MEIAKKTHYIDLYDLYSTMLTIKQREYFNLYFFEDLSLSEIAKSKSVSKNAVHDSLMKIINFMNKLEIKLSLYLKNSKRDKIYNTFLKKDEKTYIELINKLKQVDSE